MTTTTFRFSGDTVRAFGLTVEGVRAMVADVECPVEISSEPDWMGQPAITVALTVDSDEIGDAAEAELAEHIARTGLRHTVAYF